MNYRELQEMERIKKLKEQKKCMCCEVVVPEKFEGGPVSVIYGECGDIEMAMLIHTLEEIAESLKKGFPEARELLPFISKGNIKEAYKKVEKISRF